MIDTCLVFLTSKHITFTLILTKPFVMKCLLVITCIAYIKQILQHELYYVYKKVILSKHTIHQGMKVYSVQVFWARLSSFSLLCLTGGPLTVSNFNNRIQDSKGLDNKIYTIMKDKETIHARIQTILSEGAQL